MNSKPTKDIVERLRRITLDPDVQDRDYCLTLNEAIATIESSRQMADELEKCREALHTLYAFVKSIPFDVLSYEKQNECWKCDEIARRALRGG